MDFFDAVKARYSYRGEFKDEPVNREDLTKIVQAGLDAPSGCNAQTTDFVIVDEPQLIAKISAMHDKNKAFNTAKAYIACVISKVPEPVYEDKAFEIEDCAAAVENMLLAISAAGYASVWIDGWLRMEGRNEKIASLLGVPDDKIVRVILPVGKPVDDGPRREKKPFNQRAWFNTYSG